MKLNFLINSVLRSNPSFELIESGRLNRLEQDALAGLLDNPDIFGVFRQKKINKISSTKLAYKEVALLFYSLQKPGELPLYFKTEYNDTVNTTLAKLILEGVFEISFNGEFLSGTAATSVIYKSQSVHKNKELSFLSRLSMDALNYAAYFNNANTGEIASRLYCYNTVPGSLFEGNAFSSVNKTREFLKIGKQDTLSHQLAGNWEMTETSGNYSWLAWQRSKEIALKPANKKIYKLYISPAPSALPVVFERSIPILTASGSFSFKIGIGAHGLLRPDKFVAYFHSYDDLINCSFSLMDQLDEFQPQGVPFTAQLDNKGILSWGRDPANEDILKDYEGGSWRAQITEKIALVIAEAKSQNLTRNEVIEYALNKISLDGIDTVTWSIQ